MASPLSSLMRTEVDRILRMSSTDQAAIFLFRMLLRSIGAYLTRRGAQNHEVLLVGFATAASMLSVLNTQQPNRRRLLELRHALQALQSGKHSSISFRFTLAMDYCLEAAASRFADPPSVRRAMDSLMGFDARLIEGLQLDFRVLQPLAIVHLRQLLAQPVPQAEVMNFARASVARLYELSGGWGVWANWLSDRWLGAQESLLERRAYNDWDVSLASNPEAVNRWISHRLGPEKEDELQPESVGEQERTSVNFSITLRGEIDVDPHAGAADLVKNQLASDLHEELTGLVDELRGQCSSSNMLAPLLRSLDRFRSSLGQAPSAVEPGFAVPRGNALRGQLEVDDRRRMSIDPDHPPLPEGVAGALKQVTEVWNIYVANDPFLEEMDAGRRGPDANALNVALEGVAEAIASARRQKLATAAAADALDEADLLASGDTRAAERARSFQFGALRNFTRLAMRLALLTWNSKKAAIGVAAAIGGAVAGGLQAVAWVHGNAAFLQRLLADHPVLLSLLRRLISVTGGLPPI